MKTRKPSGDGDERERRDGDERERRDGDERERRDGDSETTWGGCVSDAGTRVASVLFDVTIVLQMRARLHDAATVYIPRRGASHRPRVPAREGRSAGDRASVSVDE